MLWKTYESLWATETLRDSPEGNDFGSHWLYWNTIGPSQAKISCSGGERRKHDHSRGQTSCCLERDWTKVAWGSDNRHIITGFQSHPKRHAQRNPHSHTQGHTQHPPVFTQPLSVMSKLDTFRSLSQKESNVSPDSESPEDNQAVTTARHTFLALNWGFPKSRRCVETTAPSALSCYSSPSTKDKHAGSRPHRHLQRLA